MLPSAFGHVAALALTDQDGELPYSGVISDAAGNLYGTTTQGGADLIGEVYELVPFFGSQVTDKAAADGVRFS